MKQLLLIVCLGAALFAGATAQARTATPPVVGGVSASAADVRQETFDIVWRTVKEKHFDPTFGGLDWDQIREQYAPRVADVSGVIPDGEVKLTRQALLEGRDPLLDAALAQIKPSDQ